MNRFLLILILFISHLAHSGTFYWIGGSGAWSSNSSWSFTSGGPAAGSTPSVGDTVYFNAASNLTALSTVTLDAAINVSIFDFSAANNAFQFQCALPSISVSNTLRGSVNPTFNGWTGFWNLTTNSSGAIISNGRIWTNDIKMTGNGTLLTGNLNSTADLYLNSGTLNMSGTTSNIANFYSLVSVNRTLNLTNAILSLSGTTWNVNSINLTLTHTNGRINLNNVGTSVFTGGGKNYNELL